MGLENIRGELLQKAEQESSWARKGAERQAKEIVSEAKGKADALTAKLLQDAKKQAEKEHRKAVEAATFEASTSLLKAKKELMDAAIRQAKEGLASIPAETRKRHVQALIEKAKKEISVEYILCSRKDMPFVQGCKAEEAAISGGIIAENAERTMRVDLSYDTLFAAVVEENMSKVHQALFTGNAEEPAEKPLKAAKRAKK